MSEKKRQSGEFKDLRQPGWLPTAIVVNILQKGAERQGKIIDTDDVITIKDKGATAEIHLPASFEASNKWDYKTIPPIEVIDGQHRLWSFDLDNLDDDFELPVVAFSGLDLSWQAYLFYTINIKPKKINPSLAFDLYPLLRNEEWLERFEGHVIYRESRAQELVDLLWAHPKSPWHKRINMLGEKGFKGLMVTQAAWVRSLIATLVKRWEGPGVRIGGIFGASVGSHDEVLPWSRFDQVAFLIEYGNQIKKAIGVQNCAWSDALDNEEQDLADSNVEDIAFYSKNSLLNQDQGIRALLHVLNDVFYYAADDLELYNWESGGSLNDSDEVATNNSIKALKANKKIHTFLVELAKDVATFDWRSSSAPGLTENERTRKQTYRGSSGYKELRKGLLLHLKDRDGDISEIATRIISDLRLT